MQIQNQLNFRVNKALADKIQVGNLLSTNLIQTDALSASIRTAIREDQRGTG